jgi:hypothetical protein
MMCWDSFLVNAAVGINSEDLQTFLHRRVEVHSALRAVMIM